MDLLGFIIMEKILFVINPISGGNEKEDCMATVEQWWQQHQLDGQWMETTGTDDLKKLDTLISQENPETVVACGGDGTVNLVARALLGTPIRMGILPLVVCQG